MNEHSFYTNSSLHSSARFARTLAYSGAKTSVLWELDPFLGELTAEQVHTTGRGEQVRENTVVDFSGDKETIYCGTTSGDFGLINVRLKKLMKTVPACRLGIMSLLSWPEGVICGGEEEDVVGMGGLL